MKKNRIIAAGLALLLLAGCSGPKGGVTADPDDLTFQTINVKRDSPLFAVDGAGVNAEEYLFWVMNAIAEEKYYGGLSDDDNWEETLSNGENTLEDLKKNALSAAQLYQVVRNKAAEMGVTVTDAEREQLKSDLAGMIEEIGGEEAYTEWLDEQCISADGFFALNEVSYLNQHVREKLAEEGKLTVTDADLDSAMEEAGIYAAKHILISTRKLNDAGTGYEAFTEEETAAALAKAQDLRKQLKDAGESEELFDRLMNEYSDDGRDGDGKLYYPQGYDFVYPGQMVAEFEQGALALPVGGISEPIETTYGYHIILRIRPNRETAEEYFGESYKYSRLLEQWMDEAQVTTTKAYDELNVHDFYVKLNAVNDARAIAKALQSTPSSAPIESPEGEQ